jgi:predicted dehydrogenase
VTAYGEKTLRVGLIGSGYWARVVHGRGAAQHPGVEFVGVWGRNASRTAETAAELDTRAYTDLDSLIADVDALTFAVPPDVQAEIAVRAAQAGRHLLLEKPIATSVVDARRLELAVDQARVASLVFFTRRFTAETQAWLRQLEALGGWECGRAEFVASIFVEGNPFGSSPWRRQKGALWDVGPHALSLLYPLLGDVKAVIAGAGLRDQVHLVLRHEQGRSSTVSLSLTAPAAASASSMYVYGEHGHESAPAGPFDPVVAHRAALEALIELAARPESGHPCDVHFGARVVEVLAAAEQSLTTGRLVEVQPSKARVQ